MDYASIFSHSWEIVKKNKPLWVFGMVLAAFAGGSGGGGIGGGNGGSNSGSDSLKNLPDVLKDKNFPTDVPEKITHVLGTAISKTGETLQTASGNPWEYFGSLLSPIPPIFWFSLIIGILIAIIFFAILRIFLISWANVAIYKTVYQSESANEPITLKKGSDYGRKVWARFFLAPLIPWGIFILAVLFLSIIVIIFFVINPLLGGLLLIPIIPAFLVAILLLSVWGTYAELAVALEDYPVKKALSFSWKMVKKFFWKGLVLGFLHQVFGCLYGCLSCLTVILVIGLVSVICALFFTLNPFIGVFTAVFIGGLALVSLGLMIIITGIFKAFTATNWVLFYLELKKDANFPGNQSQVPLPPKPVEYLAQENAPIPNHTGNNINNEIINT